MDNIQSPVQAPQGQAPTGEPVPNVQGQGTPQDSQGASVFEALAAKKGFKSPDDLAKAYENLEKSHTQKATAVADLERQLLGDGQGDGQPLPRESMKQPLSADEAAMAELDKFVNERVQAREKVLKTEFETKIARIELERVIERNPDFPKYVAEVKDIKGRNPAMSFEEAYLLAKARKGDLTQEAKAEGMKEGAAAAIKQQGAQVAPDKQVQESKMTVEDLLKGAGRRWTPDAQGKVDPRARAEIEMVEKELFGESLMKTPSGL